MSQAPRLGIVATLSVGTDMVDVNAAEGLGILVRAVPPHATEEVAVHTLALILALERNLPWAWTSARQGEWDPVGYGAPRRLSDLTLGVIGLGRIGRAVIERARPLFGSILGSDPYSPDPDSVSLDTLLRQSDVVSLHLPLSPETHELLDSRRIALLKPGSTIVNVSRGLLINTTALLDALGTGTLRGAALDTTDPEPLPSGHPLRADERVIITPHVAFASTATLREYALSPARAILEWSQAGTHTP
jgi:D-3-phosphoglycerate dehydrogenase